MNIFKLLKEKLAHYTWDLAYGEYSDNIFLNGLEGIKLHIIKNPYKKKWFADPFILKESLTELHLLVEEFDSDVKRGRIAHLTINKQKNLITNCSIILDTVSHLSFPAIYRIENCIYVHPENSSSGKSFMYRYDENIDKLVDPICVCNDPIADAIIVNKEEHYEMYATRVPYPNGNSLMIYESKNFQGPYIQKSQNKYNSNIARMAGSFITYSNMEIRPAQDCNGGYGKAVLFMFGNKILSELKPKNKKYAGIHTFNTLSNTFVIDLKKYDYPLLIHLNNMLK